MKSGLCWTLLWWRHWERFWWLICIWHRSRAGWCGHLLGNATPPPLSIRMPSSLHSPVDLLNHRLCLHWAPHAWKPIWLNGELGRGPAQEPGCKWHWLWCRRLGSDVDSAFLFASASLANALQVYVGAKESKWLKVRGPKTATVGPGLGDPWPPLESPPAG